MQPSSARPHDRVRRRHLARRNAARRDALDRLFAGSSAGLRAGGHITGADGVPRTQLAVVERPGRRVDRSSPLISRPRACRWPTRSWPAILRTEQCCAGFAIAWNGNTARAARGRRRQGRYLLRRNLTEHDPAKLRSYFLEPVDVEGLGTCHASNRRSWTNVLTSGRRRLPAAQCRLRQGSFRPAPRSVPAEFFPD